MEDFIPYFRECPRCNERGYEALETHSYCVGCDYSPTFESQPNYSIPVWAFEALADSGAIPGIGKKKTPGEAV